MKNKIKVSSLPLFLGMALTASSINVLANDDLQFTIKNQNPNGKPSFATGNLGSVTQGNAKQALQQIITAQAAYGATGQEDFQVRRQWLDSLGKLHTHFDQTINGLKVYGTSLILHAEVTSSTLNAASNTGSVYALTGTLAVDADAGYSAQISSSNDGGIQAKTVAQSIGTMLSEPELAYLYQASGETHLVWRTEVSWDNGPGDFGRDFLYVSAKDGQLIERHPQVHSAKSRRTYTLNGGSSNQAPGQLVCTDNQSCGGNQAAQRAHDGASWVYDYYSQKHGRDSLNGSGMALVSSVDLGEENAYWTGSQMIYGRAGNNVDYDFTSDFDVIGHEFTHGLTQFTAGLIYQNESGALNEAWSDIFGVTAESWRNNQTSSTWLLGDGLYAQQGKAFRYMNNPTQDGQSRDYYPERYTGSQDNGGVHLNSGIANLAYTLLVDGGTHPRNKTTAQVPSIGMAKAEKIFYRALTTYMNQNTQFSGARTATATAAQDLYGASEKNAVETAWCAVGVGACPSTDPDPDPDPTGELENGVAKTGLSASTGGEVNFTLNVPAGATNIQFNMTGGSGDADMYVKFGSAPTDSSYDCRPYENGNNESCTGSSAGGVYYVRLKAYAAFSGVSLTGSFTGGTDPDPDPDPTDKLQNGVPVTGLSAATGAEITFTMDVPAGASNVQFATSGGTGDADMYVKFGSAPTDSSYDCRPYKNGNSESCSVNNSGGTYYVRLKAYAAFSGVTLTGSYGGGTDPDPVDPINDSVSNISVGYAQWARYTQVLPAGYSSMTISISGGSGDVDLYVRHGAQSTSTLYDCRPYKDGNNETCTFTAPAEGTWYIDLFGYAAANGVTLNLQANP